MDKQKIKEIASIAWKGAANAFRMYPDNKHTFEEYWNGSKNQFDSLLDQQKPVELTDQMIEKQFPINSEKENNL